MKQQDAQNIIHKLNKTCNIPKQNLTLNKQSKTNYEIHVEKTPQEKEWICIEEIVSNHTLRLKLADNKIILF